MRRIEWSRGFSQQRSRHVKAAEGENEEELPWSPRAGEGSPGATPHQKMGEGVEEVGSCNPCELPTRPRRQLS